MTTIAIPINADSMSGEPEYTARQTRQGFAALMGAATTDGPLTGRSGFRPGGAPDVSVTSSTWTVGPFSAQIFTDASTVTGGYLVAADADSTGDMTAADSTNARVDILYVAVSDDDEDGSGDRGASVGYLAGTAAASPVAPDTPDGALLIGTIDVPADGDGDPTFTASDLVAVAAGGVVPVGSDDDLDAGIAGTVRYRTDTSALEVDDGSTWQQIGTLPPAYKPAATNRNSTTTMADDPDLSVPLEAGGIYGFQCFLHYVAGDGGIKIGWSVPSGADIYWAEVGLGDDETGQTGQIDMAARSPSTPQLGGNPSDSTPNAALPTGVIIMGDTSGDVTLQWAQQTSDSDNATLRKGSWMRVWRMGPTS